MKWYAGNIAEAVLQSKQVGAVFFVGIFGDDEQSKQLEEVVESIQTILSPDRYVSIRLTAESQEHVQFKQIYSNAQSPCLYFISLMGAPVEIIHGETTVTDLQQRCESAWSKHSKVLQCQIKSSPPAPPELTQARAQTQPNVIESENSNTPSGSRETTPAAENDGHDADTNLTLEQKIERARQLAAARAQLKLEQEAEEQRQLERERREAGRGMAELKRWQDEQEAKKLVEERKRDKREEQQLRQRLREQIAQDRAERNKRTNASIVYDGNEPSSSMGTPTVSKPNLMSSSPTNYAGKARLQFRMPDGSTQSHSFDQDVSLGFVRKFLVDGNHVKFSNFSLHMAFPRREFTSSEYDQSLKDLGLLPSAALLVIPAGGRVLGSAGGGTGIFLWITTLLGYILFPVTYLFGMMQGALPSSASNQPPNPSGTGRGENRLGRSGSGPSFPANADKRSSGPPPGTSEEIRKRNVKSERKSEGNIHRLRNQETDSDDDVGTWNGNSTQQKPR